MRGVRFGLFDFDPAASQLRREGLPVRLQAQPAQVLAVLLEHAGEVVTREELRSAVWGAGTFVDFDRGLNFCIAQIRAALGDSADSPRFIKTIPKQGYQFIAPLLAPRAAVSAAPRKMWNRYVLAAMAAVILCALPALVYAFRRPVNIAVLRFDNETGIAEMDRFAGGLTDAVVADLTTAGGSRYGIIGNAAILGKPRSERDLNAIHSSLKAGYVVLGQVQRNGSHLRILAHLIRLPEQTHVWVVRYDGDAADPLAVEDQLARRIAREFSEHLGASSPSARR
jgi:DNA-binding winged helix-turn-helix (wHTH) protein/TolB-like protein